MLNDIRIDMATDIQRVKSLLTEAVTILCKSILSYQSQLNIEGLLGITVDSSQVLLVNIQEAVLAEVSEVAKEQPVDTTVCNIDSFAETSVIFVSSDAACTSPDITQYVQLNGILENNTTIAIQETPFAEVTVTDAVTDAIVTDDTAQTAVATETLGSVQIDPPQTSLFTASDLDVFINNCPSAGIINDSSCDVFAEVAITAESSPDGDKVVNSGEITADAEPTTTGDITDDTDTLLLPGDVDDTIPAYLSWDDDELSDITPLNLAGPQDLSLGLEKKKYLCAICSQLFNSDKELAAHQTAEHPDAKERLLATTTEPLNLISRPLDLTVAGTLDLTIGGRIDDDDDPDSVYGMLMSATASLVAGSQLTCICGKTFDMTTAETFTTHVASCAKSKLTPYKSCETCGKTLFSHSGYVKHQRLHAGNYKYFCDICHRGFFDQTNMRAHADSQHSKVRRYACSLCNKSFYWKHHVKRHLKACGRGAKIVTAADKKADIVVPDIVVPTSTEADNSNQA